MYRYCPVHLPALHHTTAGPTVGSTHVRLCGPQPQDKGGVPHVGETPWVITRLWSKNICLGSRFVAG